ncbi:cytoplasmic phosphatidylinositol transfer protein 1 isoform X1 [Silurus asotus]|uniref:Cytoplasmic phosphatidylinositol transfer protein 1 isoform X1 n=1 Tax=Silurus asotus TaxID=30991 RepID=A0AAD5AQ41_SILAS|nr:cytoplasmic phosphatidylinositol transfer protein 1 isoform X1 [Silurus asotus]
MKKVKEKKKKKKREKLFSLSIIQYKIGQLYMINKHSDEQSGEGDGVEVIRNEPETHPKYGSGQVTEKRIYLSSKLPSWIKKFVPLIFYITEKAWNFYPYTITEYTVFEDKPTPQDSVCFLDILSDPIPEKYYKKHEDLSCWVSDRTGRGPLVDGWRNSTKPIMCSYKKVQCSFEVYGFQGRTEEFIHRNIRDILLVGHRQAVAWMDEWHGMNLEEVREFEKQLQQKTNQKMKDGISISGSVAPVRPSFSRSVSVTDASSLKKMGVNTVDITDSSSSCSSTFKSPQRLNSSSN